MGYQICAIPLEDFRFAVTKKYGMRVVGSLYLINAQIRLVLSAKTTENIAHGRPRDDRRTHVACIIRRFQEMFVRPAEGRTA